VIVKLNVAYSTSVLTPLKNSYSHELKAYRQGVGNKLHGRLNGPITDEVIRKVPKAAQ
jgi:hypothetical protein